MSTKLREAQNRGVVYFFAAIVAFAAFIAVTIGTTLSESPDRTECNVAIVRYTEVSYTAYFHGGEAPTWQEFVTARDCLEEVNNE